MPAQATNLGECFLDLHLFNIDSRKRDSVMLRALVNKRWGLEKQTPLGCGARTPILLVIPLMVWTL